MLHHPVTYFTTKADPYFNFTVWWELLSRGWQQQNCTMLYYLYRWFRWVLLFRDDYSSCLSLQSEWESHSGSLYGKSLIHPTKRSHLTNMMYLSCKLDTLVQRHKRSNHPETYGRDVIERKEVLYVLKIFVQLKKRSSRNIKVHEIRSSTKVIPRYKRGKE